MSTQQAAPGQQSAGAVTDQGPAARYSGAWFRDQLIRHAMVVVMLLIIAYFSYRSARFATLDNIQTILHRGRAVRAHRARADPRHPDRWHRPVGGQRHRAQRHGVGGDVVKGHPERSGSRSGRLSSSDCCRCGQRLPRRQGQRATLHRHTGHAHRGLRTSPTSIGGGAPINGLPGRLRQDRQHRDARPADPGAR